MADDMNKATQTNPADAGQDMANQTQTADNDTQQSKSFTQEDVERIVQERLRREREKYKDYNELKKIAEEYRKIQESQMSEQEKLQMRLAEIEREKLERERELAELKTSLVKQKVLTELGLPLSLADRIFGETEEEIRQDAEELKKLLGLQAGNKIGAPTNPAGGNKQIRTFTKEEIARMSPEEINKNWDIISEALKQGLIK
ncbi:putative prophage LambdaCh01, scaffold protein [Caldicellulosiruptor owensensis OL]|uniref:Putative prophage LambdaCh01, scaffold protein n=1 Tax=Caldicellulosiruptor owensensis (strain ATCC 700167 / DSM 13100 / OL) TaxID=632518 RepID=E4Q626_CALOW|nr:DUF4355 domain-containing protein [Caldicellulosiruptor owensensis]ADQ04400.1 putative prophage LambdaCh01, scaffold protein [Caldicellulosiruptor owensensis OL]